MAERACLPRPRSGDGAPVAIGARSATREVAPGLFAIALSGSTGFLFVREALVVVDTGAPGSAAAILRAIRGLGRSPKEVACVVVTHAHVDHVGSLGELQRFVDAPTAMHVADTPAVTSAHPLPNPFQQPVAAALSGPLLRRIDPGPARVDVILSDGDVIPGTHSMRAIHLPGHTPGSIALLDDGAVLVGDALQRRYRRLGPPSRLFTGDMPRARESIAKLAGLDFDTLCLSHFPPIRTGASRAVRALSARLEG